MSLIKLRLLVIFVISPNFIVIIALFVVHIYEIITGAQEHKKQARLGEGRRHPYRALTIFRKAKFYACRICMLKVKHE